MSSIFHVRPLSRIHVSQDSVMPRKGYLDNTFVHSVEVLNVFLRDGIG
jgi:hypothetical protein